MLLPSMQSNLIGVTSCDAEIVLKSIIPHIGISCNNLVYKKVGERGARNVAARGVMRGVQAREVGGRVMHNMSARAAVKKKSGSKLPPSKFMHDMSARRVFMHDM